MIRLLARFAARHKILFAVWEAAGIGLAAIRAYKLRAGLTILGVVMGITTVTAISSIVAGLNDSMARMIETLGSSVILIRPWAPTEQLTNEERRRRNGPTVREAEAIRRSCPDVRWVAPMEPLFGNVLKYKDQKARDAQLLATTAAFEAVHDIYVDRGRFVSDQDVARGAKVVVLGADVADALFGYLDPLDKEVTIDGRPFRVVGVMERRGKILFESWDTLVAVPLGSIQKKDQRFNFIAADIKPVAPERIDEAIEQVREVLRRERKLRYRQKDTFSIFTQDAIMDLYRQITGGIYMVMIAISSIGLLVGGVGVMNIMLVSVTERTREIGVRKALGAKQRDILWQFLTEAMTLTGAGGVLGIGIGGVVAALVNAFSPFPAILQPFWVTLAFVTSVGVGLVFGLWPAAKAARLDPVEALRYE